LKYVLHFPQRCWLYVTRRIRGRPLTSHQAVVELISATTTTTGLTVEAVLDPTVYVKGIKVTNQEMTALNLRRRRLCPNLNYTIRPNKSGSS
jgi:hypothetical protein